MFAARPAKLCSGPLRREMGESGMAQLGTVLVTGGAGYIGSHVVLALQDAGYRPVVLDNLSTGIRPAVPADVPFVEGDIGDAALLPPIIRSVERRVGKEGVRPRRSRLSPSH